MRVWVASPRLPPSHSIRIITPSPTTSSLCFFLKLYFEDDQKWNVFWEWLCVPYTPAKVGDQRKGEEQPKRVEIVDNRMMTFGAHTVLCIIVLSVPPADWFTPTVNCQEATTSVPGIEPITDYSALADADITVADELVSTGSVNPTMIPECHEEKFPCTRLYSVHKPVKECIRYLCVTSVRRMYIINKEVCSRLVCKEYEVMQDEICRQLAGLPPRRMRRAGQPHAPLCQRTQNKKLNKPGAL